jgi:hypothetical protein
MIFASPDFGAGGFVALILLSICLGVLGLSRFAILRGSVLLKRIPPSKLSGILRL